MAEAADSGGRPPGQNSEFWREFKPVAQVFRPGAPSAYPLRGTTDDSTSGLIRDRYARPWHGDHPEP
jgi:hypothetical protein